jgi:hypothetical protein
MCIRYGKSPRSEQQAPMRGLRGRCASDYRDGMKHRLLAPALILIVGFSSLTACGVMNRVLGRDPGVAAAAGPVDPAADAGLTLSKPLGGAQSAAALDQTTDAEKAIATAAPVQRGERDLGAVVVALGSPAEQGFWLRSALVTSPGKGRVVTAAGQSVNVDLQPGTGAALLSLAAYRALGLSLTDLPNVTVYAN